MLEEYNPFRMWGSYVGAITPYIVIVFLASFVAKTTTIDPITHELILVHNGLEYGLMFPLTGMLVWTIPMLLITIILTILGFLIGWLINFLWRKSRR